MIKIGNSILAIFDHWLEPRVELGYLMEMDKYSSENEFQRFDIKNFNRLGLGLWLPLSK